VTKHKNAGNDLQFWERFTICIKNIFLSPLKDLIVLELASVLAGPGVGQFFAELGAEVLKVENLKTSGDVTRSWKSPAEKTDDRSAYFCSVNWGKQSIALDLTSPEAQDIVHKLAMRSDIVISSFKPGDSEKLKVDYKTLSQSHPGLIYGQITGYGSQNDRVGYDAIIQAEAGFMFMNGEPGRRSLKMPVALMDILAGHQLKEALLLALLQKNRTGKGQFVEVSLIDAAVSALANQATNYLIGGHFPQKSGSAHPNIAPYGDIFVTAEGKELLLAVGTDLQFRRLCNILNISEISNDKRFADNVSRVRNRTLLNEFLQKVMGACQTSELVQSLSAEKIPAALVRNVEEVLQDPDLGHLLLADGPLRSVRTFVARAPGHPYTHILPPPRCGQHSREILENVLNLSPTAAQRIIQKGIVGISS
jgi:crotonobetainyl-CoA:carnitine CoA-transferase CaiB-like acyl-CoA transferase